MQINIKLCRYYLGDNHYDDIIYYDLTYFISHLLSGATVRC